jgi:DNA-binding PadR family transcriptional regulator
VLYPALRRFEEMGAVEREVVRQEGKPDRHLYRLTDRGIEVMLALLRDFPPEVARHDGEFWVRASFFDLLEPAERLEILRARQHLLAQRAANVVRLRETQADGPGREWLRATLVFREQRFRQELDWVIEAMQAQQRLL